MIAIVELKRCMTGNYIYRIIVFKLGYQKKPNLIILLVIDKNSEVGFYITILLLYLFINV